MPSLWSVLDEFSPPPKLGKAGGGSPTPTTAPLDPKKLGAALRGVIRQNRSSFRLAVGLTVGLFVVVVASPLLAGPDLAAGVVTGVAGVPAIVLVRWMKTLWQEKVQLELLIEACSSLGAEGVQTFIAIIRDRYGPRK